MNFCEMCGSGAVRWIASGTTRTFVAEACHALLVIVGVALPDVSPAIAQESLRASVGVTAGHAVSTRYRLGGTARLEYGPAEGLVAGALVSWWPGTKSNASSPALMIGSIAAYVSESPIGQVKGYVDGAYMRRAGGGSSAWRGALLGGWGLRLLKIPCCSVLAGGEFVRDSEGFVTILQLGVEIVLLNRE